MRLWGAFSSLGPGGSLFIKMRILDLSAVTVCFLCSVSPATAIPDDKKSKSAAPVAPCTVQSSNTGSFFDLNPIALSPLPAGKKAHKDQRAESWHAKGHDYPVNFTLNVCAPVIEKLHNVVGVKEELWKNISAFYELDGKTYSMG